MLNAWVKCGADTTSNHRWPTLQSKAHDFGIMCAKAAVIRQGKSAGTLVQVWGQFDSQSVQQLVDKSVSQLDS